MKEPSFCNKTSKWTCILLQLASDKNMNKHLTHTGKYMNLKESKSSVRIYQEKICIPENTGKVL